MLAIARAMMGRPRLLLLDEPSLGLAPLVTRELFDRLGELQPRGRPDDPGRRAERQPRPRHRPPRLRARDRPHRHRAAPPNRCAATKPSARPTWGSDVDLFISQLLNGIGNGVVYASVALALVLIYRTTSLLNFAQGEMALFSTYITWKLSHCGLPIGLAIVLSMAIAFVGGAIIERVLIRPVETGTQSAQRRHRHPRHVPGHQLAGPARVRNRSRRRCRSPGRPIVRQRPEDHPSSAAVDLLGGHRPGHRPGRSSACCSTCLLQRTRLGLKLRAVASNPDSSRLLGINAGCMLMLGWALAASSGALAGSLVAARVDRLRRQPHGHGPRLRVRRRGVRRVRQPARRGDRRAVRRRRRCAHHAVRQCAQTASSSSCPSDSS